MSMSIDKSKLEAIRAKLPELRDRRHSENSVQTVDVTRQFQLGENVIHIEGYQVLANGFIVAQMPGYLKFGAHAIRAGHQHRFFIPSQQVKASKPAFGIENFRPVGYRCESLDPFLQGFHCVQTNTGRSIGATRGVAGQVMSSSQTQQLPAPKEAPRPGSWRVKRLKHLYHTLASNRAVMLGSRNPGS